MPPAAVPRWNDHDHDDSNNMLLLDASMQRDEDLRYNLWPHPPLEIRIEPFEADEAALERQVLPSSSSPSPSQAEKEEEEEDSPSSFPSSPSSFYSALATPISPPTTLSSLSLPSLFLPLPPTSPFLLALHDEAQNVQYVLEAFPSTGQPSIAPPFSREPLVVRAGERVRVLEDVGEFAVRVEVCETGQRGLVPPWDLERPLERLARVNKEWNEAKTCPAESAYLEHRWSGGDDGQEVVHVHARCLPPATRVLSPFADLDGDDADGFFDDEEGEESCGWMRRLSAKEKGKGRKVAFRSETGRMFRYPSERVLDEENTKEGEEDMKWWWAGWEEDVDDEDSSSEDENGSEDDSEDGEDEEMDEESDSRDEDVDEDAEEFEMREAVFLRGCYHSASELAMMSPRMIELISSAV